MDVLDGLPDEEIRIWTPDADVKPKRRTVNMLKHGRVHRQKTRARVSAKSDGTLCKVDPHRADRLLKRFD